MAKDEKKLSVLELAKKMNREFKDNNMSLLANVVPEYSRLSTGSFGLDYVLYGGMPFGRIIKVSGLQHAGKTTGACRLLAEYQKARPNEYCVYIDVEHSLDLKFQMKINGVNLNKLIYVNPPAGTSGEDILQMILDYQNADDIGMIVLDSIPALVPQIV